MKRSRGWMLPVFVGLLVAIPIIEIYLLIQVGRAIGILPTLAILVGEAILGAWLMRREGAATWRALSQGLNTGRMPSRELADAALVLVGGVMLMFPGFITDILGFLCLLPLTRPFARKVLAFFIARRVAAAGLRPASPLQRSGDLIEGEVVEPRSPSGPSGAAQDPAAVIIRGEIDRP